MGASHGDDLCLLHQEVVGAVVAGAEELKRTELFQLREDAAEVTVTALCMSHRRGRGGERNKLQQTATFGVTICHSSTRLTSAMSMSSA